jgi:multimeric flavodoxin WrbA
MGCKYVLILKGSPRERGNSSTLADQTASGAREAGAKVECFDLFKMNIHPCDGCDFCRKTQEGRCTIEDDMQTLYPKLRAADVIVLASPIYWFTFSAQLKLCMDRWYALVNSDGCELKGKLFGILLTYGDTDPYGSGAINAIRTFQDACRFINAEIAGIVHGTATDAGDIQNQPEILKQAFQLGQRLGKSTPE